MSARPDLAQAFPDSWYLDLGEGRFQATAATVGPWSQDAQHGGPPAALLARAVERLGPGTVGRFTLELLGPVPVDVLTVRSVVLRPGRAVSLRQAELVQSSGRVVARAQAWIFPQVSDTEGGAGPTPKEQIRTALAHGPQDGQPGELFKGWVGGYLQSVQWRFIEGAVTRPGPAVVWMRPAITLVSGEPLSPLQRLLSCVDSASGVSAVLDGDAWEFMNTELTLHTVRPMIGEWVCLQAHTQLGPGAIGLATAELYDMAGPIGRSAQALLVRARQR